jgi:serine/threonine-protein kinase HipA
MMNRRAHIQIDGTHVGTLVESEDQFQFRYDTAWLNKSNATPISKTMPLREEPYTSRNLHPFFENLLPEGWLLELSTAKFKISKDDIFGLLLATCSDCFGAVEVLPLAGEIE